MRAFVSPVCCTIFAVAFAACSAPGVLPGAAGPARLEYPTFEFATSSRMFPLVGGALDRVDLAELAEQLDRVGAINEESRDFAERLTGTRPREGPSAELRPGVEPGERLLYALVPIVMLKLEPLWHAPTWSGEQVELANDAAKIVGRIGGAPVLAFEPGDDAGNRAGLEQLVRWFRGSAARPETLAAMIFTLDDGPFVGLPYAAAPALPAVQRQRIDAHTELSLSQVEREGESWVLQGVRDGEPIWSRVVSGLPIGEVAEVRLLGVAPQELGAYGWHVPFRVDWKYGREQAHLYLDPEGELLFYFLSW